MSKEKTIVVTERRLWNTLHPAGYARFLGSYARFLRGYSDDAADAFEVGHTLATLAAVIYIIESLDFNEDDWKEFQRRNQPIQEFQEEEQSK